MINMEFSQIIDEFEKLSDVDHALNIKKLGIQYGLLVVRLGNLKWK